MSDNGNESEIEIEIEMAAEIYISGDDWLSVFALLPPSQLGLEIALLSHRFDRMVEEHFKTRKRVLAKMGIYLFRDPLNGKWELEIADQKRNYSPIPQQPLPRKVVGFTRIEINSMDLQTVAFLHLLCPLFASCEINFGLAFSRAAIVRRPKFLSRVTGSFFRRVWPMINQNICKMFLGPESFAHFRRFAPSFLFDCPTLRFLCVSVIPDFSASADHHNEPTAAGDSADALSDGNAVVKWLCSPRPDGVPKMFMCFLRYKPKVPNEKWASNFDALNAAFLNACSPVSFIIVFHLYPFPVSPFDVTNQLTGERLTLKSTRNIPPFSLCPLIPPLSLLIRCPLRRDHNKWAEWENEAMETCEEKMQTNMLRFRFAN